MAIFPMLAKVFPSRRRGFTLVELLVVISIIAVLMGLLYPVFAQARRRAQQAPCTSNLRQIGQAFRMYLDDHEYKPPQIDRLSPGYIRSDQLYICKLDAWVANGGW